MCFLTIQFEAYETGSSYNGTQILNELGGSVKNSARVLLFYVYMGGMIVVFAQNMEVCIINATNSSSSSKLRWKNLYQFDERSSAEI